MKKIRKKKIVSFEADKTIELIETLRKAVRQYEPDADDLRVFDTLIVVCAAFGASIARVQKDPLNVALQFGESLTANIERMLYADSGVS